MSTIDVYPEHHGTALSLAHALGELGLAASRADDREIVKAVMGALRKLEDKAERNGDTSAEIEDWAVASQYWQEAGEFRRQRAVILGITEDDPF